MQPWSMIEVMLLGILVALIKIAELATVDAGIGMYAVGALVVLFPAITVTLRSARSVEAGRVGRRQVHPRSAGGSRDRASRRDERAPRHGRAGGTGLVRDLRPAVAARQPGASRDTARAAAPSSNWRAASSIQTTWALVIAAAICYIPANPLPVLTTTTLGSTEPDTIMGGVVFLYTSGSWPLALIVLIASVMIPLGKLIALAYLLITVQRGSIGEQPGAHAALSHGASSSAAGRCSTSSSTPSPSRWCSCSR